MKKDRFILVTNLIKNGIIQIISRDSVGAVIVNIPKTIWMQLTAEDLVRGIQGKLITEFFDDVQCEVLSSSKWDVNIRITV